MHFSERLERAWRTAGSTLCVGLDPDAGRLPAHLKDEPDGLYEFCRAIVDATAHVAAAFKPQIAYFAGLGAEPTLERICRYITERHPDVVLVLDAKRGDIGSTAEQYAREAFERYGAHAVTVNPYLGTDSVEPFLRYDDRGIFVLCRTSNPGGDDLQFLNVDGRPLYLHVAELVASRWNTAGQCGLVVGATYPDEIERVREVVGPSMPLLVPGVGAQGGDARRTMEAGATSDGRGLLVNSSRAILYASSDRDFAAHACRVAEQTARDLAVAS